MEEIKDPSVSYLKEDLSSLADHAEEGHPTMTTILGGLKRRAPTSSHSGESGYITSQMEVV
jgi:hypothetical protein